MAAREVDMMSEISGEESELMAGRKSNYHDAGAVRGFQQDDDENTKFNKNSNYAPPAKDSFAVGLSSDHNFCKTLPRDFLPFLESFSVIDILSTKPPHRRPLIALPASVTVEQALQTLRDHDLLALPIFGQSSDSAEKPASVRDQFAGVVNLYDLCIPLLFHKVFDELIEERGDASDWASLNNAALPEWQNCVGALLGISAESEKAIWVSNDSSLTDLISIFSKGIHRCLVDNPAFSRDHALSQHNDLMDRSASETESVRPDISVMRPRSASKLATTAGLTAPEVELVSQTDLLRWLQRNIAKMGSVMQLTLEEAGFVAGKQDASTASTTNSSPKSVATLVDGDAENFQSIHSPPSRVEYRVRKRLRKLISVTSSTLAILAFRHMAQWSQGECMAIPVLDEQGKVTDTLTIGDLRFVTPDSLSLLSLPVSDFLKEIHHKRSHIKPVLTCPVTSTVAEVITLLADDGVHVTGCSHGHGVWATDENGVAVGAVTLTDIATILCDHQHKDVV